MNIQEFFEKTFNADEIKSRTGVYFQDTRPRIYMNDGFSMSVQASDAMYCIPKVTENTRYYSAEIGFPSEEEPRINYYAETKNDYTNTVYGYVPCEIIDEVINKHGGIDEERTFSVYGEQNE